MSAQHHELLSVNDLASIPGRPGAVPMSKTTIYRLLRQGDFPAPIRLSERKTFWHRRDIEAWLESRKGVQA